MKAYLIDPERRTITETTYDGNWRSIAPAIDARLFTVAPLESSLTGDVAYVDDEGMLVNPRYFFKIDGYPQPLAGKGLVLGTDPDGETIEPRLTLEQVRDRITFLSAREVIAMYS